MPSRWRWLVAAAVVLGACSFDWNGFDPRIGGDRASNGGAGGSQTSVGGAGTMSTGGAGTMSTGGAGTMSSGGGGSGGKGVGGAGGQGGATIWCDDFNRASSLTVGNGWIEKTDDAFEIDGDELWATASSSVFRNNLLYRPAVEDAQDFAVSVEVVILALPSGFPTLYARVTDATTTNEIDGYGVYLDNNNSRAVLYRQSGDTIGSTLENITLSPPVVVDGRYRFTLSVQGASPVNLSATVEEFDGTWQVIGSTTHEDNNPNAFTDLGTVGVTGNDGATFRMDNFCREYL